MTARKGDWMQTFTGRQFWPFDPRPEDVCIEDIAHALSQQCRFAGHTSGPYFVAEHCVRVSQIVPPEYRLAALLHDAAEAYVVDLPRPIKNQPELAEYRRIEERVHEAIREAFGIAIPLDDPVIRHADEVLLATEARDLMDGQRAGAWSLRAEPLPTTIQPWDHVRARVVFLGLFRELRGEYPPDRHGVQA